MVAMLAIASHVHNKQMMRFCREIAGPLRTGNEWSMTPMAKWGDRTNYQARRGNAETRTRGYGGPHWQPRGGDQDGRSESTRR